MAEMLLINPRRRAKRATAKRRVSAKRRHNPITMHGYAPKRRRKHIRHHVGMARIHRRRRNPIGARSSGIMAEVQAALLGGAGALAMDVLYGQINGYIPASLQRVPGKVGIGDAVKMAITIAVGQMLNKSTRGLSRKMATGALICQSRDVLSSFVPSTMTLGFASPANIVQGTNRVGPLMQGMGAYANTSGQSAAAFLGSDRSPLLGAYSRGGSGTRTLLNGARSREGVSTFL